MGQLDLNIGNIWDDYTGRGVRVAVFDSGVEASHSDLDGNYNAALEVDGDHAGPDYFAIGVDDNDAHGTAVAGLIAAERNGVGTVGVAYDARITGVDTVGAATITDWADSLASMEWFDVVNHSSGSSTQFDGDAQWFAEMENAVINGRGGLGTVIVQAANNDRGGPNGAPAGPMVASRGDANADSANNGHFAIVVGSVDQRGNVDSYSSPGSNLLVSAFGTNSSVVTTDLVGENGYNTNTSAAGGDVDSGFSGTSAAAPMVSGIVALMLEANPLLGYRDVQNILALSARHVGSDIGAAPSGSERFEWTTNQADNWNGGGMHFSNDYGYGLVDAHAAVRLAESWTKSSTSENQWVGLGTRFGTRSNLTEANTVPNEFTITITDNIDTESIGLWMNLRHQRMSDLRIEIRSPEGTWSTLTDRTGLGGVDAALEGREGWTFYSNAFRGEMAQGEWVVRIWDEVDAGRGDNGWVSNLILRTYGSEASRNDQFFYTDEYGDFWLRPDNFGNDTRTIIEDLDGGTDTINASAVTTDSGIDLNAGGLSIIANGLMQIAAGTLIENALGGDGNDTISGNGVTNVIKGNRGNDTIYGLGGADLLAGDQGDDTLIGGVGGDFLSGGAGRDTASYASSARAVRVSLGDQQGGTWNGTATGGDAAGDNLTYIENLEGSRFHDVLTGNGEGNVLIGGAGNDQLDGGGGSDRLIGGQGNDIYTVDNEFDVILEDRGAGTQDHVKTTLASYTMADNVEILEFTNWLDFHHGIGNALANRMFGHHGNDLLEGGGGNDTLAGGRGVDTLFGGANDDRLFGEDGNDTLLGGAGNDTLDGGANHDLLIGGTGVNTLIGGSGRDTFRYSGNVAGIGTDTIFGGTAATDGLFDDDTLDFSGFLGSVDVNLASGRFIANDALSYFETGSATIQSGAITGIEIVRGTANNDILSGDAELNQLDGGAGNDVLAGGGNIDILNGGAGNDLFLADSFDIIDGGEGYDTIHADASTVAGGLQLLVGAISIEYVHGNAGSDVIDASGLATGITLAGGDGNDTLTGGLGNDILDGGNGEDTMQGGAGDDRFHGGADRDTIDGGAGIDTLYGGLGNDTLSGGADNDVLFGEVGVDTLNGGEGDDILVIDNVDIVNGGAGFDIANADGSTIASGFFFNLAGTGIEYVNANYGNDVLDATGLTTTVTLVGGYGNDTLTGGSGEDVLNGDSYNGAPGGNDTMFGGLGSDHMMGYAGDDVMHGGGSNPLAGFGDRLWGGTGNDTLFGGGNGWVLGEEGDDTLTGAAGDLIIGGAGNDTVIGASGLQQIIGGEGNDTLSGGGDGDRFDFGNLWGHDTITDFNFAEG
ncbi:MAG: S8 family serine peptidase, partial [Hyphomicrobium sp.]